MTAGPPAASKTAVPGPSLLQTADVRARAAARHVRQRLGVHAGGFLTAAVARARVAQIAARRGPWLTVTVVTLMLAPAAITWVGAEVLIRLEEGKAARIRRDHAGVLAANAQANAAQAARVRIAPLFTRPTIGATAARLAAILPADADLRALGIDQDVMTLTIAAPDPDRLRQALRDDAMLGRLRETNQRDGGDGRIWISLRGPVR
jgi:hypothetical protein